MKRQCAGIASFLLPVLYVLLIVSALTVFIATETDIKFILLACIPIIIMTPLQAIYYHRSKNWRMSKVFVSVLLALSKFIMAGVLATVIDFWYNMPAAWARTFGQHVFSVYDTLFLIFYFAFLALLVVTLLFEIYCSFKIRSKTQRKSTPNSPNEQ